MRRVTAGLLGAVVAAGSPAAAEGWKDGWYVEGFGGATWPQEERVDFSGDAVRLLESFGGFVRGRLDYDTGFVLGAAVGRAVTPDAAVELEVSHRRADATLHAHVSNGVEEARARDRGDVEVNAVMVNAVYRFGPLLPAVDARPYLGVGIGGAEVDFDGGRTGVGFAYQAMAGVAYAVSPRWSLLGEARWFSTEGGQFLDEDGIRGAAGFESVDFLVGASYRF